MSTAPRTPPIDSFLDVPGRGRIRVRDIPGPPGAPAVLLLHGLGATGRLNWGPCFRPLSEHFRVISLDHRGHGSGLRTTHFRLEECADDAAAALHALAVERAIAVGYSMGGPIASLTWQRHPQQVLGLVLCATARHFVPRRVARLARVTLPVAASALRLVPDVARRHMVQRMLVRIEHPELRDRVREDLLGHEPATVIQAVDALTRFSSHDWIGTVNVPTAILLTTLDELVPPVRQRKLASSIPGAEVFEIDGDHDACMRSPAFAPTLVRACLSVAQRASASPAVRSGAAELSRSAGGGA